MKGGKKGVSHLISRFFGVIAEQRLWTNSFAWLCSLFFVQRIARHRKCLILTEGTPSLSRQLSRGSIDPEINIDPAWRHDQPNSLCKTRGLGC